MLLRMVQPLPFALDEADTGVTERRDGKSQGLADMIAQREGPVPKPTLPLNFLECDCVTDTSS